MSRVEQSNSSHGSLKDLQTLVNSKSYLLDYEINKYFDADIKINWVSPLKEDNYAEYRDENFISILGLNNNIKTELSTFWPKRGPQWDALGKYNDTVFILEAKANIPELKSPPTEASNDSKILIENSLNDVKKYLNINNSFDWTNTYYQYTNRIAHLYYLRVLNNINAYLIFLYFINDTSVNGPKTIEEWKYEINKLHEIIGLEENNKLSKYIIDIFINYNDLKI